MKQNHIFISTFVVITAVSILMISLGFTNAFAQTFEIDVKKKNIKLLGADLFSDQYDIKGIRSNVTGLENIQLAKSAISFASIKEDEVQVHFDIKVPQGIGSKSFKIENVGSLLKVTNIEEKSKQLKTYTLKPVLNDPSAIIAGHKIIDGYLDLNGKIGTIFLNLEP